MRGLLDRAVPTHGGQGKADRRWVAGLGMGGTAYETHTHTPAFSGSCRGRGLEEACGDANFLGWKIVKATWLWALSELGWCFKAKTAVFGLVRQRDSCTEGIIFKEAMVFLTVCGFFCVF